MSREATETEYVAGLARGLAVIEAFDEANPEMTLSEVARRTGLAPATARRSLKTLQALGYVRHHDRRYLLSARVLTLASAYLRASHVEELAFPELRRIVDLYGDAASVSVLDGHEILYVAHLSVQRATRPRAGIGVTYPAFATSMGRVLLADLPDATLEAYFGSARFPRLTDRTETDPKRLKRLLREVRRHGYAGAADELDYGVTALAVPIRDAGGRVIAALNSSGFSGRVTLAQMIEERLSELRVSAERIAGLLRRHPTLLHSIAGGTGSSQRVPLSIATPP